MQKNKFQNETRKVSYNGVFKNWLRVGCALTMLAMIILLAHGCKPFNDKAAINLFDNHLISLADVFENARIVPLEDTEQSLIAQITHIVYYDDRFYVLDGKQQKILCFDNDGKFVSTISKQGHGPGEYV